MQDVTEREVRKNDLVAPAVSLVSKKIPHHRTESPKKNRVTFDWGPPFSCYAQITNILLNWTLQMVVKIELLLTESRM